MIASRFRSVALAASVATAALGCYMVSLRVASERNALEHVDRQILTAQNDIRALSTELATRGRLGQLERWNADVLGLAAPKTAQYLKSEVQLASLVRPTPGVAEAKVIPVSTSRDAPIATSSAVVSVSYRAPAPAAAPKAAETAAEAQPAYRVQPLIRHATFERVSTAPQVTRVALLDTGVLSDIGREARTEGRKARP